MFYLSLNLVLSQLCGRLYAYWRIEATASDFASRPNESTLVGVFLVLLIWVYGRIQTGGGHRGHMPLQINGRQKWSDRVGFVSLAS